MSANKNVPSRFGKRILSVPKRWTGNMDFLATTALVLLAFSIGGGSRPDIVSLVVLRPVSVLLLAFALWRNLVDVVVRYPLIVLLSFSIVLLPALHLLPLPPEVWQTLPGRHILKSVDDAANLGAVWRPLSLDPIDTWNSLYSLAVPLAVLLLGLGLKQEERHRLLYVLLAACMASIALGVLQAINPGNGVLYFYRVTNDTGAVVLFANRNHQALLLAMMYPLLAIYALHSDGRARSHRAVVALAVGFLLIPLILVTGSRAGLISAVIGLSTTAVLFPYGRLLRGAGTSGRRPVLLAVGVIASFVAVIVVAMFRSRAEAIDRVMGASGAGIDRSDIWSAVWKLIGEYLPLGAGIGAFVPVFQINESQWLLTPEYLNHAHNDYLEILVTGGIPAAALLLAALVLGVLASWRWLRAVPDSRTVRYGRLGCALLLMFGVASIFDYPLRVPSLECVFAIAVVWAVGQGRVVHTPRRRQAGL